MKKNKTSIIGLSIFLAICTLLMIITAVFFSNILDTIYRGKDLEGIALFFTFPIFLISLAVSSVMTLIDLILAIIFYKLRNLNRTFFIVNTIVSGCYLLFYIGSLIFLIAR